MNIQFNPEAVTAKDFDTVRKKWKKHLVGDENNNISNRYIKVLIKEIEEKAIASQKAMNKNSTTNALFGTAPVVTSNDMGYQYQHLHDMAMGYGTYGTAVYKDEALKNDILFALEWLYKHLYGKEIIGNHGWRDIMLFNWWDWYNFVPRCMMATLFVLYDELSKEDILRYLAPFEYIRTVFRTEKNVTDAQSRIYLITALAVLTDNAPLIKDCMEDYELIIEEVKNGDGVHKDYTYICHTHYHYIGVYGVVVLCNRLMRTVSILAGTALEMKFSEKKRLFNIIKYAMEPFYYNGASMSLVMGRKPWNGLFKNQMILNGLISLLGMYDEETDIEIKKMMKRHVNDKNLERTVKGLSVDYATELIKVLEDENIQSEGLCESRVFGDGDRVVMHARDFSGAVAMSSERIAIYESINYDNVTSWFTGDGMLYVYNGTEYNNEEYGEFYWRRSNPQLKPGTTEDWRIREAVGVHAAYHPDTDFVGGVDMDNKYLMAAMDFKSYNNTETKDIPNSGGGVWHPVFRNDLVAKKAYFMFDNEIVLLGAGITSTQNSGVYTTVENKIIKTDCCHKSCGEYEILEVTASGHNGNSQVNVLDESKNTYWSADGDDVWIGFSFFASTVMDKIGITQYKGKGDKAFFSIETSREGVVWEKVGDFVSSGETDEMEVFDLGGATGRFIRYVGHGRDSGKVNMLSEMKVFPKEAEPESALCDVNVTAQLFKDSKELKTEYAREYLLEDTKTVFAEGFGGYYFPGKADLKMRADTFFQMWLEHGENPKDATYEYVLLPGAKSNSEVLSYAENPGIEILSNTKKLQAVYNKNTNITAIAFHEAGSCANITVASPVLLMKREKDGVLSLSVSDPTGKLDEIVINIEGKLRLLSTNAEIAFENNTLNIICRKESFIYKVEFLVENNK